MDRITVKTDDLREVLRQIGNDHMKYIELSINEDDDPDEPINYLNIQASIDGIEFIDYDSIDEVKIDE